MKMHYVYAQWFYSSSVGDYLDCIELSRTGDKFSHKWNFLLALSMFALDLYMLHISLKNLTYMSCVFTQDIDMCLSKYAPTAGLF